MIKTYPFVISDNLKNDEIIAHYLAEVFDDPNPYVVLRGLEDAVRAKGIDHVAEKSGLDVETIKATFAKGAKPSIETIRKIANVFGVPFHPEISPA